MKILEQTLIFSLLFVIEVLNVLSGSPSYITQYGVDFGQDILTSNWTVDYSSYQAQFKFHNPFDNSTSFIAFQMVNITEYNVENEEVISVSDFFDDSYQWMYTNGTSFTYQDYTVTMNEFVAELSIPVSASVTPFRLTTFYFDTNASVSVDNETFILAPKTLKWTYNISNWPFESNNNTLELCIRAIQSNASSTSYSVSTDNDLSLTQYKFSNGFQLYMPTTVTLDENIEDIIDIQSSKISDSNAQDICFTFDYFENDLNYDPWVDLGETSSGSKSSNDEWKTWTYIGAGVVGAIILVGLAYYFCFYKPSGRGEYETLD